MEDLAPATESVPRPRSRYGVIGFVLAPVLVVLLPVVWWMAAIPIGLTLVAKVVYVLGALAICAAIASSGTKGLERRTRFGKVFAVLLLLLLIPSACTVGWDEILRRTSVVTTESEVPSPDGRLVLVEEYIDSGALGGDFRISVRGRLIPGLMNWSYIVTVVDQPDDFGWAGSATVRAHGKIYDIPRIIVATSW